MFQVFLNGRQVFELHNIVFRIDETVAIDGIFFATHFGGGNTSFASTVDTHTYFRNFVLSLDPNQPVIIGNVK